MDTNKDALEVLQVFIQSREHLTNHPLSGSGRVTYNCALDCLLRNIDAIYNALQTQAELVEACNEAHKWLATKRDRPSLCGMGHEEYAKTLIMILEKALARAEGKE